MVFGHSNQNDHNFLTLIQLLVDVDEWGQVLILHTLTRYLRTQFVQPEDESAQGKACFGLNSLEMPIDLPAADAKAGGSSKKKKPKKKRVSGFYSDEESHSERYFPLA